MIHPGAHASGLASHSHVVYVDGAWCAWNDVTLKPPVIWRGALTGEGVNEFQALAATAGHLLLEARIIAPVPPEVRQASTDFGLPNDCPVLPDKHQRWCRFLHWLAWAGPPMRAERRTWEGGVVWPYDLGVIDLGAGFESGALFGTPPHQYFSALNNLFLRSCLALDWIAESLIPAFDVFDPAESDSMSPDGADAAGNERGTLTDAERCILDAMLRLGAIGRESRRSRRVICGNAGYGHGDGTAKKAFRKLKRRGFITAERGSKGGTWLTAKGRVIAR